MSKDAIVSDFYHLPVNHQDTIDWSTIEQESATLLSQYIQFDTTNPPGQEAIAIEFLADTLRQRGFEPKILLSAPGRANLVTRLPGKNKQPPCLLYAHADVVSAEPADWNVPPFSGQIDQGFVWGRGALDCKGFGIILIQALTLLKQLVPPLDRDIILCIAADEEATSQYGVIWLLKHHWDLIKAEFVWDEGGFALQTKNDDEPPLYAIGVTEKRPVALRLTARGTGGHSSIPCLDNPQDRLVRALHRLKQWSSQTRLTPTVINMLHALAPHQTSLQAKLFAQAHRPILWPWLRSILSHQPFFIPLIQNTLNLTMLHAGQGNNIIPSYAEARLDLRLLPDEDLATILKTFRNLINDRKVSLEVENAPPLRATSEVGTPFYNALMAVLPVIGPPGAIIPYMTPGATDSRFFREMGMQAYGFMPMLLTNQELQRIHGVDERVSTSNLRWGVQAVFETLRRLGRASGLSSY